MLHVCVRKVTSHQPSLPPYLSPSIFHPFLLLSLRLFRFDDKERGEVTFNGNILFTHFGEIDYNPFQPTRSSNNELDNFQTKSGGATIKPKHSSTFA